MLPKAPAEGVRRTVLLVMMVVDKHLELVEMLSDKD